MRVIYTSLFILVSIIIISLTITNSEDISIHYYFGSATLPLSLALGITLILGVIIGMLACLKTIVTAKYHVRILKNEIKIANTEISNLRAIPIRDQH